MTTNIDELVAMREDARASRDWKRADEIRDILAARGSFVVDTKDGQQVTHTPRWTRQRWEDKAMQDKRANAAFDAWLFTMSAKLKKP